MIALGNNTYRTLDDKFYLGTQQIGKVYLGETLIYPEEKIIIGGITIDTNYRDIKGNMFDLGITANRYTDFELCMYMPKASEYDPTIVPEGIWHIFGVYPRTSGQGDNNDCRTITTNNNGVNIRGVESSFTGSGLSATQNFYLLNGTGNYRFGYAGTDGNANSHDLSRAALSPSSDRRYFISLEGSSLKLGHKFGKFYWEQELAKAIAEHNNARKAVCEAEIANINSQSVVSTVTRSNLNGDTGHLWYNCVNMFTNTPNADRTQVSGYDDSTYNYFGYTNSSTLIYLLIIQKNSNDEIVAKYLYTQSSKDEQTVDRIYTQGNTEQEYYCKNIPVLKKYTWDSTLNNGAGGFDEQQATTIYPFKYCKPYRG